MDTFELDGARVAGVHLRSGYIVGSRQQYMEDDWSVRGIKGGLRRIAVSRRFSSTGCGEISRPGDIYVR